MDEKKPTMRRLFPALNGAILAFLLTGAAAAQIAPSPAEVDAYTGLHAAAVSGDAARVIALLNAPNAGIDARDPAGRTPLHVAAFHSHDAVVAALAAAGADMNALENDSYDIVTIAAVADDAPLLRLALSLGASPGNVTSRYDGTALIAAAHLGHVEVVARLIAAGAPLDHINNLGWTALMEAVVLGDGSPRYVETVRLLIEAGANTLIADNDGVTPRQHAKRRGYDAIVALFPPG